MTVKFAIDYKTVFGENVYISGSSPEFGEWDETAALALDYVSEGHWEKSVELEICSEIILRYRYIVKDQNGRTIRECGQPRMIVFTNGSREITCRDSWLGNGPYAPFLSAPFTNVLFPHDNEHATLTQVYHKELILKVTVPLVAEGESVLVCGSTEALGAWNPRNAPRLSSVVGSRWEKHLRIGDEKRIEYKFVKRCADGSYIWEDNENHVLDIPHLVSGDTLVVEHPMTVFGVAMPRLAGTAVPVFSLRSEGGFGIGDFTDIRLLVDWAVATGQHIVQLLPVNDTTGTRTWTDSYPYSCISTIALHPIYLNPAAVIGGDLIPPKAREAMEKERRAINELPKIDYERVLALKEKYTHLLYDAVSEFIFLDPEYLDFFKKNREWLVPYAAFCALRDKFGTADFSQWGKYAVYSEMMVDQMQAKSSFAAAMKYCYFVQYLLHTQLSQAHEYANSRGVALKGDIPIGVMLSSVEVWSLPESFNTAFSAGAPPDAFAEDGQNWGFPTYNWDVMALDGYAWWKKRLGKMAEYFDAYRIDHVLGFFRIWEIPRCQRSGLLGHFSPALPLSVDEIGRYGFYFEKYGALTPRLGVDSLRELFGINAEDAMRNFMDINADGTYSLLESYSNQVQIENWAASHKNASQELVGGLMKLATEVLFLEDPFRKGCYHPRINAQKSLIYKELPTDQKRAYDMLYDDFFYRRNTSLWESLAYQKLPELISATNMLVCAEDLGMIPECVPHVLDNLRILSLEVQRMPKDPAQEFAIPATYPYLSVCTTGSHDTSTLQGWWIEDAARTQRYYNNHLHIEGVAPATLEPWLAQAIIEEHLDSKSMLAIFPLQDWFATAAMTASTNPEEDQINVPANPHHYWRWRMHITLEELLAKTAFNEHMAQIILKS